MFMDRQELSYAFKFIKGEFSLKKAQKLFGMTIYIAAIVFNVIMSSLGVFLNDSAALSITSYQDFSATAILGVIIFPLILFVFSYQKLMNATMIFPQTNNTRFVKDFTVGCYGIGMIILGYVGYYFLSFGFTYAITFLKPETYVITSINIIYLLTACFSIMMYGLLVLSLCILMGAVIRKIKLFSLLFTAIPIICLSFDFDGTIALMIKMVQFYIHESSMIMFAVKILVTFVILVILAYIINNITPVENNVNYKSPVFIVASLFFVILISLVGTQYMKTLSTDDIGFSTGAADPNIYSEELDKREIDVSHLEEGTVLKLNTTGIYDDNSYVYMEHEMELINQEELIVSGDTLVIFYRFTECESGLVVDLSKYLNESFDVYLEGDTLYMNYNITQGVRLLNVMQSFLVTQFEVFADDNINTSNYHYIRSAYCAIEFE